LHLGKDKRAARSKVVLTYGALVGAMSLARALSDEQLSREISKTTAALLKAQNWLQHYLNEETSRRWAFFINVPLAIMVIANSLRHISESRNATARQADWLHVQGRR